MIRACWSGSSAFASSSAHAATRSPVVTSTSTSPESSSSERPRSVTGGSFDADTSSDSTCTSRLDAGLKPSLRFHSVGSMCTPSALTGVPSTGRSTRRPVGVLGSARVNWSLGQGSRQAVGSVSSQVAVPGGSLVGAGRVAVAPRSEAAPAPSSPAPSSDEHPASRAVQVSRTMKRRIRVDIRPTLGTVSHATTARMPHRPGQP